MYEIDSGIGPYILLLLSNARLNILSFPKLRGIVPEIMLFRRSRCFKDDRFAKDLGIRPVSLLSAKLSTVNRLSFPISKGISPEIWFPIRSRIRRNGREVMHGGIIPEMPFQSAITMVESLFSLQMEGEIDPVM